ncbi:MAG: hypothetical protein ACE5EC_03705 [Phycisphaerae bacterium]
MPPMRSAYSPRVVSFMDGKKMTGKGNPDRPYREGILETSPAD